MIAYVCVESPELNLFSGLTAHSRWSFIPTSLGRDNWIALARKWPADWCERRRVSVPSTSRTLKTSSKLHVQNADCS
jgi:hypothetical protein